MVILQSLALAALITYPGREFLRRRSGVCYALAALCAFSAVYGVWSGVFGALPAWVSRFVTPMFTKGALSGALFCFVMFAGAVPNGSPFMRQVMPVRGELSIVAGILAAGHGLCLGKGQLAHALSSGGDALALAALAVSLVLIALMLPLLLTSFRRIRRRMQPRRWKRLQRAAYAFYALMLLHVLLYNLPAARRGMLGARINTVVYGALLLGYGALRVRKALLRRGENSLSSLPGMAAAVVMAALMAAMFLPAGAVLPISAPAAASLIDLEVTAESEPAAPVRYADGKYSGAGVGYNGRLTVSVRIEEGAIVQVRLTGSVDDEPYLTDATEGLFPAVLAAQGVPVDAVSGATSTSEGLIAALQEALSKAVLQ